MNCEPSSTVSPPPSLREKLRDLLPETARSDFDRVTDWEDQMLAFSNAMAEECDRLRGALEEISGLDYPVTTRETRGTIQRAACLARAALRPQVGERERE